MFNRLKKTLKDFVEKVSTRELKEHELNPILDEVLLSLVENDVAYDVAEGIVGKVKGMLLELKVKRGADLRRLVVEALESTFREVLSCCKYESLQDLIRDVRRGGDVFRIMFVGVNGVGKTTTIAKVGKLLLDSGFKVLISASDTYRAGAQEQLEIHARNVGIPVIKHKYGSDPAAVAYDAIAHARRRYYDVVLIDTAGRMHTDIDLMDELRKIKRVAKPHLTLLVVDSLTGNDAVEQMRFFEEAVGVDGIILTKVDADEKGGIVLSLTEEFRKPILYVGVGQRYEDLRGFDPDWYLEKLMEGLRG